MANYDHTELRCSNTKAVKACAEALNSNTKPFLHGEHLDYREGDTELFGVNVWGVPNEKIAEVSKQFPNDVITCKYSFEYNRYSEIHTFEYCNGEEAETNLESGYMSGFIPLNNENDRNAIYEKAEGLCRKLDTTEKNEDGKLFVDWCSTTVCFTFEYDAMDGKKYRIEATKEFNMLAFKVFEGRVNYDWQEIPNNEGM